MTASVRDLIWKQASIRSMFVLRNSTSDQVRLEVMDRTLSQILWGYPDWRRTVGNGWNPGDIG